MTIWQKLGFSAVKFFLALIVSVIVGYQGVEAWVNVKIEDAMERMVTIRNGDMALIDSRLKNIEEDTKIIKSHILKANP
jgi:intracellular septation protein A